MDYVGRRAELGVGIETTRGAYDAVKTPDFWIPYTSISADSRAVVQVQEGSMGNIADSDDSHITKTHGEGSFEAQMYDKAVGAILCNVMGATPASAGATPTTHTYTLADESNSHTSLCFFVQDPNGATAFPGAMIDSYEISVEPEGIVTHSISFRSGRGKDWQQQSADYTSLGSKWLHQHCKVKIAAAIADLAAASLLDLRSLTFTIEKAPVDWDDMGTVSPQDILNRQMSVSGTMELAYSDRVWRNYFLANTARAMEIQLDGGANSRLTIQMPKVEFQTWEPNKDLNEIATQTLEFKAHYDAANAAKIISSCVLINNQASY